MRTLSSSQAFVAFSFLLTGLCVLDAPAFATNVAADIALQEKGAEAAIPATDAVPVTSTIEAKDAYAFPSLGMKRPGVAFVTLTNTTDTERKLIGASANEWCDHVELHEHKHVDGVMTMNKVDAITIPAQGSTALKPGGYHLMMMGLVKPLRAKESITVTLTFDDQSTLDVPMTIRTR